MRRNIVCLDQNAWIELSRIFYGDSKDESARSLPSRLFDLAHQGSHIFPISFERLHETQKDSNRERRIRLARFMVDLSDGLTMGPAYKRTIPLECRNHLTMYHCLPRKLLDVGESIIGKGLAGIFGAEAALVPSKPDAEPLPRELEKIILSHVNSNEFLFQAISGENEELRRELLMVTKSIHDEAIIVMQENLAKIPPRMDKQKRHDQALSKFFVDSILPIMAKEAMKVEIPLNGSIKKTPPAESPEQFLRRSVPSAYVSFELGHARDKGRGGRVLENDFNDISFLSYAIPYAKIVVTERGWVQLARQLKLDKMYGSHLLPVSKIGRLTDLLSET